jgi:hypothetical protein
MLVEIKAIYKMHDTHIKIYTVKTTDCKPFHNLHREPMWPHQAAKCKDSSPVLVLWQSFVSAPQTAVTVLSDFLPWYHSPNKRTKKIKGYVISCHTSHCEISPVYDRLENRSLKLFPQMDEKFPPCRQQMSSEH